MLTRPIVVGADGSEESLHAVEWACAEAARRKVPLRIVSVSPAPSRAAGAAEGSPLTVDAALRDVYAQTLTTMAEFAASMAPGVAVETELLSGAPGQVLARDASGALMLVTGAFGFGGYGEMRAGPVSRYVASHATCPVVVVRDQGRTVHGEILVAVRDPDEAAAAFRFAFEEAALRGARVLAVHAWHWPAPSSLESPLAHDGADSPYGRGLTRVLTAPLRHPDTRAQSAQAAARLAEALHDWQQRYPRVPASPKVIHGHPGRVLAAMSGLADLTVIGHRDGHESLRMGSGPVLQAVLNHAQGPVAVIPPG
jgi:nucleotide-binding universal stress UspA family protein